MADDPLLNDLMAKLGVEEEADPAPDLDDDDPLGPHLKVKSELRSMLAAELRR